MAATAPRAIEQSGAAAAPGGAVLATVAEAPARAVPRVRKFRGF
jgi:hypothetical protein